MLKQNILNNSLFTSILLIVGIPFAFWLIMKLMKFIQPSKRIYERNRKASILCIRVNRRERLHPSEKNNFEKFVSEGVIKKNSNGIYELSDKARIELFEEKNSKT